MRLTQVQKDQWDQNGFLLLEKTLTSDQISKFTSALDSLYSAKRTIIDQKPFNLGLDWKFIINEDDTFIELIDLPATFGYVLDILGPCIQLCMSHALTRPAKSPFQGFIHTDGGQAMQRIVPILGSLPLQIKIQYFLTDVLMEHSGNFTVVPGSHRDPFPINDPNRTEISAKTQQILARAGDAAVFVNSLWHGVTSNDSDTERKSIIFGYNQLFLRPYDYHIASQELLRKCTPRQRRLLGDVGTTVPQAYYYAPMDQVTVMENISSL